MFHPYQKKLLTRTIDQYRQSKKESLAGSCALFGLSRQVYYRRIQNTGKRKARAAAVLKLVGELRMQMPRLGTRKLYYLLSPELKQMNVGRDMLFKILKANHMLVKPKRSYHITTNSRHKFRKHKNLVSELVPSRPEQLWVSDITYVGNREKPQYLALVTDAYSKKIVGYDLSASLDASGALRALKAALKNRSYKHNDLIHHSDRGLQYCSYAYQKALQRNKILCSMTESYDPCSNAVAERVNGILKQEFLNPYTKGKAEIMDKVIAESISIYNKLRPHTSCAMLTPEQMHAQNSIQIKTYKTKNTTKLAFNGT